MKRIIFSIIALVFTASLAFAQEEGPLDVQGYEAFLAQKEEIQSEYDAKKAEIRSQIETLENENALKRDRIESIRSRLAIKAIFLKALRLGMGWLSVPFFYITLILAFLYLFYRKRDLFERYRKFIIVIGTALFVLYTTSLFAAPTDDHPLKEEMSGKLDMINRLLDASDLDRAIVKIEIAKKGKVDIGEISVASDRMIPLGLVRVGSLEADYTLGCLYLEAGQSGTAAKLFKKILAKKNLKLKGDAYGLGENILWYFTQAKDTEGVHLAIMGLSANTKEQRSLLDSVKFLIDAGAQDQAENALSTILKRMKQTQDYLQAATFLHGLGRSDESSVMYEKALTAARSSSAFLSLARYAYDNGMTEAASAAMEQAYKKANTSFDYLAYAKYAKEKGVENAGDAYDSAFSKARSCTDFVQFGAYAHQLGQTEQATEALTKGLPKGNKVEDLLTLIDLAIKMNLSEIAQGGMERALKVGKRFDDFMTLSDYANLRKDDETHKLALSSALSKARKLSEFKRLTEHCLAKGQNALAPDVIAKAASKLKRRNDLMNYRSLLLGKELVSELGPIHESLIKVTNKQSRLYELATKFANEGSPGDADLALIKIAKQLWSKKSLEGHLEHCLDNKQFVAARETCRLLIKRRKIGATRVKDPLLLDSAKYLPNGETIIYWTLLGTLHQKTGDLEGARNIFEEQVSQYVDYFLKNPDARVGGDLNTYFYLKQSWELAGDTELLSRFGKLYKAIGEFYLGNYRKGLDEELAKLEPRIEKKQVESLELDNAISSLRKRGSGQSFRIFATLSRFLAYAILVITAIVIAVVSAWRYQKALTRFHLTGFISKFSEVLGFELCFTVIMIPLGVIMMLYAQLLGIFLHIQQETEMGKMDERLRPAPEAAEPTSQ
jgi:hypothetical protein